MECHFHLFRMICNFRYFEITRTAGEAFIAEWKEDTRCQIYVPLRDHAIVVHLHSLLTVTNLLIMFIALRLLIMCQPLSVHFPKHVAQAFKLVSISVF